MNDEPKTRALFSRLEAMAHAVSPLYSYWGALFPSGNDHGQDHIQRVLEKLDALLGNDPCHFVNSHELFLTIAAIIFHDIGLLRGRSGHPAEAQRIIDEAPLEFFIDEVERDIVARSCATHGSSGDIASEFASYDNDVCIGPDTVAPRKVAALVRLADELDEDRRRANRFARQIQRLETTSERYWEFCERVDGIKLDHGNHEIVIDMVLRDSDMDLVFDVAAENKTTRQQLFLQFVAEKLVKIEREREKMMRFLPKGPRFHLTRARLRTGREANLPRIQFAITEDSTVSSVLTNLQPVFNKQGNSKVFAALIYLNLGIYAECINRLSAIVDNSELYPQRIVLRAHYLAATAHSLRIPELGHAAASEALKHLTRWFELGNRGVWESEGDLPALEVYRMSRDLDLWQNLAPYRSEFLELIFAVPVTPSVDAQLQQMPEPADYPAACGSNLLPDAASFLHACLDELGTRDKLSSRYHRAVATKPEENVK